MKFLISGLARLVYTPGYPILPHPFPHDTMPINRFPNTIGPPLSPLQESNPGFPAQIILSVISSTFR